MKAFKPPSFLCTIAALAILLAGTASAYPTWVRVETLTVDGVANCLPGHPTVHRSYGAGIYRFTLDLTSPGIQYSGDRPFAISAFLMLTDNSSTTSDTQTFGLSQELGIISEIETSSAGFAADSFIEDPVCGDNGGNVRIFVDSWQ